MSFVTGHGTTTATTIILTTTKGNKNGVTNINKTQRNEALLIYAKLFVHLDYKTRTHQATMNNCIYITI